MSHSEKKASSLEKEFEFYQSRYKKYLKDHKGQFVLIKGENEHGFYATYEEALEAALKKFGNQEVLIKEITDEISANYVSHFWIEQAFGNLQHT